MPPEAQPRHAPDQGTIENALSFADAMIRESFHLMQMLMQRSPKATLSS